MDVINPDLAGWRMLYGGIGKEIGDLLHRAYKLIQHSLYLGSRRYVSKITRKGDNLGKRHAAESQMPRNAGEVDSWYRWLSQMRAHLWIWVLSLLSAQRICLPCHDGLVHDVPGLLIGLSYSSSST